jgi:hypothetical protein
MCGGILLFLRMFPRVSQTRLCFTFNGLFGRSLPTSVAIAATTDNTETITIFIHIPPILLLSILSFILSSFFSF